MKTHLNSNHVQGLHRLAAQTLTAEQGGPTATPATMVNAAVPEMIEALAPLSPSRRAAATTQELAQAFDFYCRFFGGSRERALASLEALALGQPDPDFWWSSDLAKPDPGRSDWWVERRTIDPQVKLQSQLVGTLALLEQLQRSEVPATFVGISTSQISRQPKGPEEVPPGFAGPAGRGLIQQTEVQLRTPVGEFKLSFWTEHRGEELINGGWLSPVPRALEDLGAVAGSSAPSG